MSMASPRWMVVALAVAAAAFACSSNNGGGVDGSSCISNSLSSTGNSACSPCLEASCSSLLGGFESACSDYLTCICPGGTLNQGLESQCSSKATEGTCNSSAQTLLSCIEANCQSQCTTVSSSGSGGGGAT